MTNTITTDLDEAHPSDADTELTSANSALARIGADCLTDGPVGRVGLEIEAHCFDLADPLRRPGWDEVTGVIAGVANLPGGSLITVEPGGAVELSGPPADGPLQAINAMAADRTVLHAAFAEAGLGLVLAGRRPAAAGQARQPRRPLPRDGAVLRGQPDRRGRGGDDDVHGVGAGQSRSRAAVRVGGAGPARARAGPDDGRDRCQLAAARRQVHRLAQLSPVGVEPARLGALRSHPRRGRRGSGQRLGALRDEGTRDAGAPHTRNGRGARSPTGCRSRTGPTVRCCSATADRRWPTSTIT